MVENKAVLASIRPKWCELIASGKKTIEVRKTRPKTDEPFKVYMYCTKPKKRVNVHGGFFYFEDDLAILNRPGEPKIGNPWGSLGDGERLINGTIIGEFVCDRTIDCRDVDIKDTCLTVEEWLNYSEGRSIMWGWHISDLVIYDEPKELKEFMSPEYVYGKIRMPGHEMIRPPQSWCYVDANTR